MDRFWVFQGGFWIGLLVCVCVIGCGEQGEPAGGSDSTDLPGGAGVDGPVAVSDEPPLPVVPEPPTPGGPPLAPAKKWGEHYYMLIRDEVTWEQAQARCARISGHLVWIESQEENDYLVQMIAQRGIDRLWIGARHQAEQGIWLWTYGSGCAYTNWAPGEPDGPESQHVAELVASHGQWNGVSPEEHRGAFICKW